MFMWVSKGAASDMILTKSSEVVSDRLLYKGMAVVHPLALTGTTFQTQNAHMRWPDVLQELRQRTNAKNI